jgi:uncharacterized protein YycO
MEQDYSQLIELGVSLVTVILTVALLQLKKYLATKTDNELMKGAEDKVINFLVSRIKNQQANVVKGIKEKLADGKFTKDEAKSLLNDIGKSTLNDAKAEINSKVFTIIGKEYMDIDAYLRDKIETVIEEIKK